MEQNKVGAQMPLRAEADALLSDKNVPQSKAEPVKK
jgi:hypothetical protein